MPKAVAGLDDITLLSNLHVLSPDLLIPPTQVGLILGGRTAGQLAEDRAKGIPPPFVMVGGSVRYRLGDVLEVTRKTNSNTAQALVAKQLSKKGIRSFATFLDRASVNDQWPFIIAAGKPIDFFGSIDQEFPEASCRWLTLVEYLELRRESASHEARSFQATKLTEQTIKRPSIKKTKKPPL